MPRLLLLRLSDGGRETALSLLDQCAAYSENISMDTVSAAAGIAGRGHLFDIIEAAVSKQPETLLQLPTIFILCQRT